MDIRSKPEPKSISVEELQPATEHPTIAWLKANRHKLGPFKVGTVLQETAEGLRPVEQYVPGQEKEQETVAQELNETAKAPPTKATLEPPKSIEMTPDKQKEIAADLERARAKLASAGLGRPTASTTEPKEPQPDQPSNPGLPPEFVNGPNIIEFLQKVEENVAEDAKEKETSAKPPSAGGLNTNKFCKHCGWDQDHDDNEVGDTIDKLSFLQATLGQIPFKKQYTLLNGRLLLEFRTLSSEESDMCFTQVAYDAQDGRILEEGQYFRTLMDYRLCLGLSAFKTADERFNLPQSSEEWKTDPVPTKHTKLKQIVPWIYTNVLRSEPIRRAAAASFFRFQRMAERLEAHMDDKEHGENFWPATEKPL